MGISYDRVLRISAEMGNGVCDNFLLDNVVCPSKLRGDVFTSAAIDNIDHNPSSPTAHDSFHGTGISLIQHPDHDSQGRDRGVIVIRGSSDVKTVGYLPSYYTDVQPVVTPNNNPPIPGGAESFLQKGITETDLSQENMWLQVVRDACDSDDVLAGNYSWAAYHAHKQVTTIAITPTALLPLFHDQAHSVAMIRHAMNVVKAAINKLNPGQVPVVTLDQPLFAIAKQIQWNWPSTHGENLFVIMLGGLHIEMASLKTAGDWLKGSGWTQALVLAEIATIGKAKSFLQAAHVGRTRYAHQVTAATLHILQRKAYSNYICRHQESMEFTAWCNKRIEKCPQFQYWAITLILEISILCYIRSLRESNFRLYMDSLQELAAAWFFAMNHTNYARWLPVHLRDMIGLVQKQSGKQF